MASIKISRKDLIGCWKVLSPSGIYIELREDGTARKKESWKGVSDDFDGDIRWRIIEPSGLEMVFYQVGESEPLIINEYQAKYFKGKNLEWWHTRMNDSLVENVMLTEPVCWMRTRPPKTWESA